MLLPVGIDPDTLRGFQYGLAIGFVLLSTLVLFPGMTEIRKYPSRDRIDIYSHIFSSWIVQEPQSRRRIRRVVGGTTSPPPIQLCQPNLLIRRGKK